MFHAIINLWYVPAIALVCSVLYISWKRQGGSLLFRVSKTDGGSTILFKWVLNLGWTFGSILCAICLCCMSAL